MKTAIPALVGAVALLALGPRPAPAAPAPALAAGVTPINSIPETISTPGRYCVTSDLALASGQDGILVAVSGVEIDLGGFDLFGGAGSGSGITTAVGVEGVRVHNGSVSDWDTDGVKLGRRCSVSKVRSYRAGFRGIVVGDLSIVEDCDVLDSADRGIILATGSIVRGSTVEGGVFGIGAIAGGTVSHCRVTGFTGTGIQVDPGGLVESSTASTSNTNPGSKGIRVLQGARAVDCAVNECEIGYELFEGASLEHSSVRHAVQGIVTEEYCQVVGCSVTNASDFGIRTGPGSFVARNLVSGCGDGILTMDRSLVEANLAPDNDGIGLELQSETVARGNVLSGNGLQGLVARGDRNRIEANTLDSNQRGLVLQGVESLAVSNRAAGNAQGDFTLPFGNPFGPTLNTKWAIQGSVPHANFRTPFP